jgi:hypothetical protein
MANGADLEKMFVNAVQAFNAAAKQQGRGLQESFDKYLDEKAVVYSKKDGKGYFPKAKALAFLMEECSDHPQFFPLTRQTLIGPSDGNPAQVATIHGQAKWKDDHGVDTLSFNFTFVCNDNEHWLFSTLRAA